MNKETMLKMKELFQKLSIVCDVLAQGDNLLEAQKCTERMPPLQPEEREVFRKAMCATAPAPVPARTLSEHDQKALDKLVAGLNLPAGNRFQYPHYDVTWVCHCGRAYYNIVRNGVRLGSKHMPDNKRDDQALRKMLEHMERDIGNISYSTGMYLSGAHRTCRVLYLLADKEFTLRCMRDQFVDNLKKACSNCVLGVDNVYRTTANVSELLLPTTTLTAGFTDLGLKFSSFWTVVIPESSRYAFSHGLPSTNHIIAEHYGIIYRAQHNRRPKLHLPR